MEMKSRVYALVDAQNRITRIEGEYTLPDNLDGWTLVEEGKPCDRLNLAQSHYLPSPLRTDDGICRWKWDGKICVLRSDAEIEKDRKAIPPAPISDIEMLKKQVEAQNAMLDFYEECIAEMAEIVYA